MILLSRLLNAAIRILLVVVLVIGLMPAELVAQTEVLVEDVEGDTIIPSFGPNRANYLHGFISIGSISLGSTEGSVNSLLNQQLELGAGLRYKRKLSKSLDIAADLQYRRHTLYVSQKEGKVFPDTNTYHDQQIRRHGIPVSLFLRINHGRRGDYIAKFFDIGVYADLKFAEQVHVWENTSGSSAKKMVTGSTDHTSSFVYGALLRYGWNKYALEFRYRPVALIETLPNAYADMVPYTLSFQFGFHK